MLKLPHIRSISKISVIVIGLLVFLVIMIGFWPKSEKNITQEVESINLAIRRHYQKQADFRGLNTETVVRESLAPAFMIRQNKIFSRMNREIFIGRDEQGHTCLPTDQFFALTYLNLDKNMCKNLISQPFDISLGLREITLSNDQSSQTFSYGGDLSLPITPEVAEKHCQTLNTVVLVFE